MEAEDLRPSEGFGAASRLPLHLLLLVLTLSCTAAYIDERHTGRKGPVKRREEDKREPQPKNGCECLKK